MDPSKNSPETRDQLTRIERLGEVIICTELEPDNPIHLFAARRGDDHGDLRTRAHSPKKLKAVETGEHDVQDRYSVIAR